MTFLRPIRELRCQVNHHKSRDGGTRKITARTSFPSAGATGGRNWQEHQMAACWRLLCVWISLSRRNSWGHDRGGPALSWVFPSRNSTRFSGWRITKKSPCVLGREKGKVTVLNKTRAFSVTKLCPATKTSYQRLSHLAEGSQHPPVGEKEAMSYFQRSH